MNRLEAYRKLSTAHLRTAAHQLSMENGLRNTGLDHWFTNWGAMIGKLLKFLTFRSSCNNDNNFLTRWRRSQWDWSWRSGVNFISVLCTAFALEDPESIKNTVKSSVSIYAFGIYVRKSCMWNVDEIEPRCPLSVKVIVPRSFGAEKLFHVQKSKWLFQAWGSCTGNTHTWNR